MESSATVSAQLLLIEMKATHSAEKLFVGKQQSDQVLWLFVIEEQVEQDDRVAEEVAIDCSLDRSLLIT